MAGGFNKPKNSARPQKRYQRLLKRTVSPYGYRKLLSEKQFLNVQYRARGLGVQLQAIDFEGMELRFAVQSGTYPSKSYTVIVQLNSLKPTDIIGGKNIAEVLRNAKLKVYCSCPSFNFWGYAYKAWRYGYGLWPQTIYPRVRNPHLRGYLCKHLYSALSTFPFIVGSIGKKMKDYWTAEQAKQIGEQVERALDKIDINELVDEL